MFGVKLDDGRGEDLFFYIFWSSPDNWGNLDVGWREDLVEMFLTVTFKF